jgi:hypothetical protein
MAAYETISAVSQFILSVFQQEIKKEPFSGVKFKLFETADFAAQRKSAQKTVSLFLYHVSRDASVRKMPPMPDTHGTTGPPGLTLNLHYLATVWSRDAVAQQRIFGWLIQTLNRIPVITAGILDHYAAGGKAIVSADQPIRLIEENYNAFEFGQIWARTGVPYQLSSAFTAAGAVLSER